ncbi:MAG: LacI family transcriptional regulator [Gemmatimonadota bacterium]|nr:LacI family transcriptional regulator [Gemmatimonadota bacterium]
METVTSRDVARLAGVSQPTVSLVLGGNPRARVADATRTRVLRAAEELGYRPNLLARGLVRQRSYAVGVLVPDLANPFFAEVVRGVERVAAGQGYAVLLSDARETPPEKQLEALRARLVDGVILEGIGAALLSNRALDGLNVVLIDEPSERWPGVASDALSAGRLVAEHLLGLGHRAFGFVGPATDVFSFRMRERGFFSALRDAGVRPASGWVRRAPPTVGGGEAAMRKLLAEKQRPTAVFCVNDLIALGALKASLVKGVRVPEQLSLMGCDDIEMARVVTPELSTVAVPTREMGARAARLLLRQIGDDAGAGPRPSRLLPVHLVLRGTTAPAPDASIS